MSEPPERATATTSVGVEELPTYAALQQQEGARFGSQAQLEILNGSDAA